MTSTIIRLLIEEIIVEVIDDKVVAVELVDAHADRAGGNERIEIVFVLVEETERVRHGLMGEIAPDLALSGRRIVRLADAGQEQKLHVEQRKCAEQHEIGRPPVCTWPI